MKANALLLAGLVLILSLIGCSNLLNPPAASPGSLTVSDGVSHTICPPKAPCGHWISQFRVQPPHSPPALFDDHGWNITDRGLAE